MNGCANDGGVMRFPLFTGSWLYTSVLQPFLVKQNPLQSEPRPQMHFGPTIEPRKRVSLPFYWAPAVPRNPWIPLAESSVSAELRLKNIYFVLRPTFCADNEHSDRQPKRDWHACVILQSPFKEWLDDARPVAWQRLRPVRVSFLADQKATVVYAGGVNLFNCRHDSEPLHRRHLPDTLQDSKSMIIEKSV